ncbi:MAG: nucleotidyltransferase family protein [Oscillospiraceae bacterium]|nr:nucleotidyltransferase family protein [Oscillospiraceae bacterium]
MKPEYLDVIKLLRSAVTGEKLSLSPDFSIAQAQDILKHHGVQTMGYMGAINCGVPKTEAVMQQLFVSYMRGAAVSQRQLAAAEKLFGRFEEKGIDYLPLKGLVMKKLYPYPELRPMGDGDILIRIEQYPEIQEIMINLGYQEKQEADHELPWIGPGLYVELHKRLVPTVDPDLFSYYGDGWKFAKKSSGSRYCMSDEDFFIFLFAHFAKHFRGGGIGCRHVVDLFVYRNTHPEMDESYILTQLKALCLDAFYQNMLSVLDAWFFDKPYNACADFITQRIFDNGIWGTAENLYIAESLRTTADTDSMGRGRWKLLMKRLFLNLEEMQYRYPVLVKHKYLLPVFWIWRLMELPFKKSHVVSRRISLLRKESENRILQRKKELEYVGFYNAFQDESRR